MTTIRRVLSTLAPVALGAMLLASTASATPITVTISVYGNIPSFTLGSGPQTTAAAKFNITAINNAIASACTFSYICSGATLNNIDFYLQAHTDVTLNVGNTSGSTGYIRPFGASASTVGSNNGTFASATSGIALMAENSITATDGITTSLVVANPTLIVNTDVRRRRFDCGTGTTSSTNFMNCLTIQNGGKTFTGDATDTGVGNYNDGMAPGEWATVLAAYVGTGTKSFTLNSQIATSSGTGFGTSSISNSAVEAGQVNGFQIDYTYTYTEIFNPVPEPATMALTGAVLLAAGLIRRRRSNR